MGAVQIYRQQSLDERKVVRRDGCISGRFGAEVDLGEGFDDVFNSEHQH
jgi:hypothetical protein